jgi:hypothetical protein
MASSEADEIADADAVDYIVGDEVGMIQWRGRIKDERRNGKAVVGKESSAHVR